MNKIRFAIIGCGRISEKHISAIKQNSNAKLVAVSDNLEVKVKEFEKQHNVRGYTNYHELLESAEVDVVNICSPSGKHAEMAIAAAQANKHVVLEKPMALNYEDAKKILAAFKKSKTHLAVVLQNRFNEAVNFIKKREKLFGRLNYISAQSYLYRPQSYYNDNWHGTRAHDGGALTNQGSHYVDLVLYFKNEQISQISAFGSTLGHKMECEDTVSVNIKFKDNTLGNIQVNTISYPQNFEGSLTLFYEKATIKIGSTALNEIVYWKGELEKEKDLYCASPVKNINKNGHTALIDNLISHIQGREKLFINPEDGARAVQLIDEANESIRSGKIVDLTDL